MALWTWTTLRWGWTRSTDKRNSSTNGPRTETAEGSKQALMYCCFEAEGAFCWVKWDSDDRATDSLATLLYYYYLLKKRLSLARLYTCVKIIPFQECRPIYCVNSLIILSYWGYSHYSRLSSDSIISLTCCFLKKDTKVSKVFEFSKLKFQVLKGCLLKSSQFFN